MNSSSLLSLHLFCWEPGPAWLKQQTFKCLNVIFKAVRVEYCPVGVTHFVPQGLASGSLVSGVPGPSDLERRLIPNLVPWL